MTGQLHVVLLAGGRGTRLKSSLPKVLHRVSGLPLLEYCFRLCDRIKPDSVTVVVGHQASVVEGAFQNRPFIDFVRQEPQLGTGHALLQTSSSLEHGTGTVLVLSGDVPKLTTGAIQRARLQHEKTGAALTALTAVVPDPTGYGRIIRSPTGDLEAIVEEKDATESQREIDEINSGIYLLDLGGLFPALRRITNDNAQREYYLTDLVGLLRAEGRRIVAVSVDDPTEILGINTLKELADMTTMMRQRKADTLMTSGVAIEDPSTTYIDPDVTVGPETIIRPGVYLEGSTSIGERCIIHSGVRIVDSAIGDDVEVRNFCVIQGCRVASRAVIGPFAHLRPESDVHEGAHVGNFVELKKTVLGAGSKANHLSYLGDAVVGERVNVGAGTITCNYDGAEKHRTTIDDGAFVGTNSSLVAPVRIGAGAYVAAGSTITQDVPPDSLAVARSRQVNKEGWSKTRVRKGSKSDAAGPGEPGT